MKRKILLIILCLLLVCSCKKNTTNNILNEGNNEDNINNKELYFNNFTSDIAYTQKNCDSEYCEIQYQVVYRKINVDTNISPLIDVINEINNNIDKYYQKAIDSKLGENEKCGEITEKIYYSYNAHTYIFWHIDDEYIFLSQKIDEEYLCTNEEKTVSMKTYIYDKNNNKIITQTEYLEKEDLNNEYFINLINENLKYNNYDKQITTLDEIIIYKINDNDDLYFSFLDSSTNMYVSLKANSK